MGGRLTTLPVWHEGERRIQETVGVAERMAEIGTRIVRDFMPDQHRVFYTQLPFIVLGSVDAAGDAWATLVEGRPGFVTSPTPTRLEIATRPDPGDPASRGTKSGDAVGLLGIDLHTRRRNRTNGLVTRIDRGIGVDVDQSFGNCPRYIQLRDFRFVREPGSVLAGATEESAELDNDARVMIERADTFFVASYVDLPERRQVDVSHRGGRRGFVRVGEDGVLTIPDFAGNLFFSTLGNILLNGKAGLLFIDFETGDVLQLSGDAEVVLDGAAVAAFQGADRVWTFRVRHAVRRRNALALRWQFSEAGASPSSLMTGDWGRVEKSLRSS